MRLISTIPFRRCICISLEKRQSIRCE